MEGGKIVSQPEQNEPQLREAAAVPGGGSRPRYAPRHDDSDAETVAVCRVLHYEYPHSLPS